MNTLASAGTPSSRNERKRLLDLSAAHEDVIRRPAGRSWSGPVTVEHGGVAAGSPVVGQSTTQGIGAPSGRLQFGPALSKAARTKAVVDDLAAAVARGQGHSHAVAEPDADSAQL